MRDLRSEIRAAFEKAQTQHPPPPNLRETVVEGVVSQPRRQANPQWLVVIAAIVIGALVVTGLVTSRLNRTTVPSRVPPAGDYGPPPTGVALIYVDDPNHLDWLIGYDWTGKPRGTVKLAHRLGQFERVAQAPDGSAFEIADRKGSNAGEGFLDRFGAPTGSYLGRLGDFLPGSSLGDAARGMWADDSTHFCFLSFGTGAPTFATQRPGQAPHAVAVIPEQGPWLTATSFHVASCSFKNDRAILFRNLFSQTGALWVLRLSDGKILDSHGYPRDRYNSVVASSDSVYVAENGHTVNGVRERPTQIRRVSDWTVVASWNWQQDVATFSGDDSVVLLYNWTNPTGAYVMDWRSESVLWHSFSFPLVGVLVQPAGRSIAVAFAPPELVLLSKPCGDPSPPPMCHPTAVGMIIIKKDGTETPIPGRGTAW